MDVKSNTILSLFYYHHQGYCDMLSREKNAQELNVNV